jgi:hypothetical protein
MVTPESSVKSRRDFGLSGEALGTEIATWKAILRCGQ